MNGLKYSPNGKQLLISASPQAFDNIGNEVPKGMIPNGFDYRLYRYTFATQKVEPILKNFKPSVNSFTWSYGDGNIYFKADDGYDISYFRLNPKTLKVTRFKLPSLVWAASLSLRLRALRVPCSSDRLAPALATCISAPSLQNSQKPSRLATSVLTSSLATWHWERSTTGISNLREATPSRASMCFQSISTKRRNIQ